MYRVGRRLFSSEWLRVRSQSLTRARSSQRLAASDPLRGACQPAPRAESDPDPTSRLAHSRTHTRTHHVLCPGTQEHGQAGALIPSSLSLAARLQLTSDPLAFVRPSPVLLTIGHLVSHPVVGDRVPVDPRVLCELIRSVCDRCGPEEQPVAQRDKEGAGQSSCSSARPGQRRPRSGPPLTNATSGSMCLQLKQFKIYRWVSFPSWLGVGCGGCVG